MEKVPDVVVPPAIADVEVKRAAVAVSTPPVFRLPREAIEQILFLVSPDTFASLVVLNRAWRAVAQTPQLYAHHLSRCPSYSLYHNAIAGPFDDKSLDRFKRQFAQEVKRNLFEAYLRPRRTNINLISTTTSSSAAFPGGEALSFSFSPSGLWCLALTSSRIFVLDLSAPKIVVKRELKVLRRPLSAAILDSGEQLAVLSSDHKANVYDLTQKKPKLFRPVTLDNPPHYITLSPRGEVLAVAYDGGIEVHSLSEYALPSDKRVIKCNRADFLSFSHDGTMLLGTTQNSKSPSTVILSAPYFTDMDHEWSYSQLVSHIWTSQIIFPNSSRDCSHAALLPCQADGDSNWTLTYDRVFESFRAVRTDDLRNGTTYFTGPKRRETSRPRSKNILVPSTLPTITRSGDLVAAGFSRNEVWLYGVPEGLDDPKVADVPSSFPLGTSSSAAPDISNGDMSEGSAREADGLPRWQVLVDKNKNVFSRGKRIIKIPGFSNMTWVKRKGVGLEDHSMVERLVIAAPGGVCENQNAEPDELACVEGGRLVILDFAWQSSAGQLYQTTIELGNTEPELLEEENVDMATEVALVRRRTVARRDGAHTTSVADILRPTPGIDEVPPIPPVPSLPVSAIASPTAGTVTPPSPSPASPSSSEGLTLEEAVEALDGPYSHIDPRSRNTLYRSATAVEASRRRNPPPAPGTAQGQFRRTDGTELPHESDADNWIPPPPPYTPDAEEPLPQHLQQTLQPRRLSHLTPPSDLISIRPVRAQTVRELDLSSARYRRRSSADVSPLIQSPERPASHRQHSHTGVISGPSTGGLTEITPSPQPPANEEVPRPVSPPPPTNSTPPPAVTPSQTTSLSRSSSLTSRPSLRDPTRSHVTQGTRPISLASITESRSTALRSRNTLRVSPASPHIESSTDENATPSSMTAPTSPSRGTFPPSTTQITLSGRNLQQRLDYPLPPPPPPTHEPQTPIAEGPIPVEDPPLMDMSPPHCVPYTLPRTETAPAALPLAPSSMNAVSTPSNIPSSAVPSTSRHSTLEATTTTRMSTVPSTYTIHERTPSNSNSNSSSIPPIPSIPAPSAYQLNTLQNRYTTYPQVVPPHSQDRRTTPSRFSLRSSFINGAPPAAAFGAAAGSRKSLSAASSSSGFLSGFRSGGSNEHDRHSRYDRSNNSENDVGVRDMRRSETSAAGGKRRWSRAQKQGGSVGSTISDSSSNGASASTPNLRRPQAQRLDTIHSIASRTDSRLGRRLSRVRSSSSGPGGANRRGSAQGGGLAANGAGVERWDGPHAHNSSIGSGAGFDRTGNAYRDHAPAGIEESGKARKKKDKSGKCIVM